MDVTRNHVDRSRFNSEAVLPFQLRLDDFALAMQDVYDFFYDVNIGLVERGLERLDDMCLFTAWTTKRSRHGIVRQCHLPRCILAACRQMTSAKTRAGNSERGQLRCTATASRSCDKTGSTD